MITIMNYRDSDCHSDNNCDKIDDGDSDNTIMFQVMIAIYDDNDHNNDDNENDKRNDIYDCDENDIQDEEGYCIPWIH